MNRSKVKKIEDRLPSKLSELIIVALQDLRKAEKSKHYVIDMGTWHQPNGHCSVCFGGAVMAGTFKMPRTLSIAPYHFRVKISNKLSALDSLRTGRIVAAASLIHLTAKQVRLAQEVEHEMFLDYVDRPLSIQPK